MNERWILFILSGIMLAILLYSGNGASSMLYRFFRIDSLSTQERMIESLKIENQTLKNQLNKFQLTKGSVVQEPTKYKNTFVYSQYPTPMTVRMMTRAAVSARTLLFSAGVEAKEWNMKWV
jgi:ABC-type lipoprotein export system ATPase subunit